MNSTDDFNGDTAGKMGVMQQKRPAKPRPLAPSTASPPTVVQPTPLTKASPSAASKVTLPTTPPLPSKVAPSITVAPPPPSAAAMTNKPLAPKTTEDVSRVLRVSAPQTDCTTVKTRTERPVVGSKTTAMKPTADVDHVLTSATAAESTVKSNSECLTTAPPASDKKRNTGGEEMASGPPTGKETERGIVRSVDEDLGLHLSKLALSEDDKDNVDLADQLKELKIKEKADLEESTDDSDLVSRGGPHRIDTKPRRPVPYVLEQHYVSSDRHGGATVLYPSTAQPEFGSSQNIPPQEISLYWQGLRTETEHLSYNDCQNVQEGAQRVPVNELQNLLCSPALPETPLTQADLKILEELTNNIINGCEDDQANIIQQNSSTANFLNPHSPDEGSSDSVVFDIDQIIESDKYDNSIQDVKQELSKEALDRHLPPTPPDSAYDSDEGTIGSPASTIGFGPQRETDKIHPSSPSFSTVIAQDILQQTAYPTASVSPILHTVTPGVVLKVLVPQKPQSAMSPKAVLPLIPPTTPPVPALAPRPILPGVNIPSPCNEPAIKRITSLMTEKIKDKAWALIFAEPDSEFINADEDGNKFLENMLSNRHRYKNFMEPFHVVMQRLKRIIQGNHDMARMLLASPNRRGHSPLDIACRYFQSGEQDALVVRYLADAMVEEGLEIGEELDDGGNTLLHKICNYGDKAQYIMAELLSMRDSRGNSVFDVNRGNNERKTPLHIAGLKHSEQTPCTVLAQLLMRSGASASEQEGCSGNTVFHCVASVSCDPNLLLTLLAITKDVETVVNTPNFTGDTPLHMVAANPTITLEHQRLAVQHLIHYRAQPRLANRSGRVPLSLVAADRKQDIKTVLYHR